MLYVKFPDIAIVASYFFAKGKKKNVEGTEGKKWKGFSRLVQWYKCNSIKNIFYNWNNIYVILKFSDLEIQNKL